MDAVVRVGLQRLPWKVRRSETRRDPPLRSSSWASPESREVAIPCTVPLYDGEATGALRKLFHFFWSVSRSFDATLSRAPFSDNASGHQVVQKTIPKELQQIVFTFLHFHLGHPFALSSILLLPSFTVDLMCFPWGTSRGVKRVSERTQNCKTNPRDITCVACIIYVACVLCALCAVCAARVCVCAVCVEQSNRTVALLVLCRAICHALARAALECPGGDTADDARLGRPRPRIPRHHLGMQ